MENRDPLERHCRRRWSIAATCLIVGFVGAVSLVRLEADENQPAPARAEQEQPDVKPTAGAEDERSCTYTCRVTDGLTGRGIPGTVVTVRRWFRREDGDKVIGETRYTTDADGRYTVTIPPEQAQDRDLCIKLDAYHAGHTPRGFVYGFSWIRKMERLGEVPFFEHVELYPGQAITGTVQTPDGKPAAGVQVLAYSRHAQQERFPYGALRQDETDENGRFRLVIATPGDAVLWIHTRDYASTVYLVPDERGDTGTHVLHDGLRLSGQVLDTKGDPVPGVRVNAQRMPEPNDEIVQLLNELAVMDPIRRSGLSDGEGRFALAPLPPGEYRIEVTQPGSEPAVRDRRFAADPVFMPFRLTLREGEDLQPLEIRAVPHVEIHAQHVDSSGKPPRGDALRLIGRMDGEFFRTRSWSADGRIVIRAPHGLENVKLVARTNEHVIRHRLSKDGPLRKGRRIIDLGTLDADVHGIEIVRNTAPSLVVKAVDGE